MFQLSLPTFWTVSVTCAVAIDVDRAADGERDRCPWQVRDGDAYVGERGERDAELRRPVALGLCKSEGERRLSGGGLAGARGAAEHVARRREDRVVRADTHVVERGRPALGEQA